MDIYGNEWKYIVNKQRISTYFYVFQYISILLGDKDGNFRVIENCR